MHLEKSKKKLQSNKTQFEFDAIGTNWKIDITTSLNTAKKGDILELIKSRIETFDKTYSRFRTDSLVWKISQKTGRYEFPPDSQKLFSIYKKFYDLTNGLITPLVGNLLDDAGYDATYTFIQKQIRPVPKWEEAIDFDYPTLTVHEPVVLDFGAAGKGYLIDIIGKLLEKENIQSFCIDAGGDIKSFNSPEVIGLEHPTNFNEVVGLINLNNKSICGSAGNRRKWNDFHHIVSPKTQKPVSEVIATWAIAKSTILADALSTALFFIDPEKLFREFDFEYLIINSDYSFKKSQNLKAEIFTG